MTLDPPAVKALYERRIDGYDTLIRFFRTRRGLQTSLRRSDLLQPRMKVLDLDAGCGSCAFRCATAGSTAPITWWWRKPGRETGRLKVRPQATECLRRA